MQVGWSLPVRGPRHLNSQLEGVDAAADVLLSAALADFDFFVLADFVPASASFEAVSSVEEALADFDFFALVDFVPAASVEAVESALASVEEAFADLDFFELVDFVPDAESADAVASPEDDLADLDFFEVVDAVLSEESLSESDFAFFDFDVDVEDFFEAASLESVELASVDFFFDLVVFFAGVVLESLESVACAFTGAALANASPSPTEIKDANTYFLNRFMLFSSPVCAVSWNAEKACHDALLRVHYAFSPAGARLSRCEFGELTQLVPPKISALPPRFVLAAYRVMPPWLKLQRLN